jgi:hypothetical protein
MNNNRNNKKNSVLEDMERLKQRREDRKNKPDKEGGYINTRGNDYAKMIIKKKKDINLEEDNVIFKTFYINIFL